VLTQRRENVGERGIEVKARAWPDALISEPYLFEKQVGWEFTRLGANQDQKI
jgi:hypothetical protein